MKKEYDFSKGERGKFYRRGAELSIPIYLEPDVAKVFQKLRGGESGSPFTAANIRHHPAPDKAARWAGRQQVAAVSAVLTAGCSLQKR